MGTSDRQTQPMLNLSGGPGVIVHKNGLTIFRHNGERYNPSDEEHGTESSGHVRDQSHPSGGWAIIPKSFFR
jgi:hypothetical protein